MLPIHNGLCLNLGLETGDQVFRVFSVFPSCFSHMPEYHLNCVRIGSSSVRILSDLLFSSSPMV